MNRSMMNNNVILKAQIKLKKNIYIYISIYINK